MIGRLTFKQYRSLVTTFKLTAKPKRKSKPKAKKFTFEVNYVGKNKYDKKRKYYFSEYTKSEARAKLKEIIGKIPPGLTLKKVR